MNEKKDRRVLQPEAAKKVLVFAIVVFVILCIIGVLKIAGVIG